TTTGTSFALTGLTPGTSYSYDVVAIDSAGKTSPPSAAVTFTTPTGSGQPTPPGTPGTPTASNVTASGVTLAWTAATPGSNPIAGYDVFTENGSTRTKVAASTTTTSTVTGLAAGTTYVFDVVARDATGLSGTASGAVTVTTPANPPPNGGLKVQYKNNDTNVTDNQVKPGLNLVNTGNTAQSLANVTIRYWFTADGGANTFTTNCDYAAVSCGNLTQKVVALATPVTGADHYLEVGFTAGTSALASGASTGDIQNRINKTDWSMFNQANDYSYGTSTSYVDSTVVTVYVSGQLVWGTEPH
ncbi:MAG TPA: cellulose binding domain-containing protein, partial [Pseudonocardiaceae bacterium]|nr:cellulose binding domain-containing protein [Pseudonocardiaceae bacterium]